MGLKTSLFKTKNYTKPEPVKIVYGGGKKLRKLKKTKQQISFSIKKEKKKLKIE